MTRTGRRRRGLLCLLGALAWGPAPAGAADGGIDPTFGTAGTVRTAVCPPAAGGFTLTEVTPVQTESLPDGGQLAVVDCAAGLGGQRLVVRLRPDGALDPSFGTGGGVGDQGTLAVAPDGASFVTASATPTSVVLRRYSAGGTLQKSASLAEPGTDDVRVTDVDIAPDGTATVGGSLTAAGDSTVRDPFAARASADLDPIADFGGNGVATASVTTRNEDATAVALAPDGKVVLAGGQDSTSLFAREVYVARLLATGALDTSFDGNGALAAAGPGVAQTGDVAIEADGDVLVGARFSEGSYVLRRRGSDGAADPTYAADATFPGYASLSTPTVSPPKLLMRGDGRLVVSEYLENVGRVWRLQSDGTRDPTFNTGGRTDLLLADGRTATDAFGTVPPAPPIAVDPAGRLLVAAGSEDPDSPAPRLTLFRLAPPPAAPADPVVPEQPQQPPPSQPPPPPLPPIADRVRPKLRLEVPAKLVRKTVLATRSLKRVTVGLDEPGTVTLKVSARAATPRRKPGQRTRPKAPKPITLLTRTITVTKSATKKPVTIVLSKALAGRLGKLIRPTLTFTATAVDTSGNKAKRVVRLRKL